MFIKFLDETEDNAATSRFGNDALGEEALQTLEDKKVDVRYVQRDDRPTGQVNVQLDSRGQAEYEFATNLRPVEPVSDVKRDTFMGFRRPNGKVGRP